LAFSRARISRWSWRTISDFAPVLGMPQ
jgi:hypothetical protein